VPEECTGGCQRFYLSRVVKLRRINDRSPLKGNEFYYLKVERTRHVREDPGSFHRRRIWWSSMGFTPMNLTRIQVREKSQINPKGDVAEG
jgi:hypothetical protein